MKIARFPLRSRQTGVVLFVAMVVLIIMTLASFSLVRAISSGGQAANNLTFRQGTTAAADVAFEAARQWITSNSFNLPLFYTSASLAGYSASRFIDALATPPSITNPVADDGKSWRGCTTSPSSAVIACAGTSATPIYADPDGTGGLAAGAFNANGYRASYYIQRQCAAQGAPSPFVGMNAAGTAILGNNCDSKPVGRGDTLLLFIIYEITVRVEGPRNTVSFYQSTIY